MVRVGTFNLNNLFSRFNFQGAVSQTPVDNGGISLTFNQNDVQVRTYRGNLVRGKEVSETQQIAQRIIDMDADVLAVQEVEHIEILKEFNNINLNGMYSTVALVEGNDNRLIDIGVLSKLPLGAITSHQTAVHPADAGRRIFSRDLLQVAVLDPNGNKLFNIYNTHLKSHFVPFDQDPVQGAAAANTRRQRQAETISRIIGEQERVNAKFILTGDMNDPPGSPFLQPMLTVDGQPLTDALANPTETRPAKAETPGQGPGPQHTAWTHRYNPPGPEHPRYELYDHIWVSQALAGSFSNPTIDRRTKHGGDGSDHDPAWIDLNI